MVGDPHGFWGGHTRRVTPGYPDGWGATLTSDSGADPRVGVRVGHPGCPSGARPQFPRVGGRGCWLGAPGAGEEPGDGRGCGPARRLLPKKALAAAGVGEPGTRPAPGGPCAGVGVRGGGGQAGQGRGTGRDTGQRWHCCGRHTRVCLWHRWPCHGHGRAGEGCAHTCVSVCTFLGSARGGLGAGTWELTHGMHTPLHTCTPSTCVCSHTPPPAPLPAVGRDTDDPPLGLTPLWVTPPGRVGAGWGHRDHFTPTSFLASCPLPPRQHGDPPTPPKGSHPLFDPFQHPSIG